MAPLSFFNALYLGGVVVAFGVFAVSLLSVWIATNLPDRRPVRIRAEPPEAFASNVHRLTA